MGGVERRMGGVCREGSGWMERRLGKYVEREWKEKVGAVAGGIGVEREWKEKVGAVAGGIGVEREVGVVGKRGR